MDELNPDFGKNNNPKHLHDGHFTAWVGNYPKFSTYVAFYQDAVEILFKRVSMGNETADSVAFPLLFLMRHTLELGYKYSLFHLCALNSTIFDPKNVEGHSLVKLHKRLGTEYHLAVGNGSLPESDKESFDRYYALTASSMKRFEELDASSTKTRFPNSDESPNFVPGTTVNLLELKNEFDDAMILLTTMADVIDQYDWSHYPEFYP
jgi:hypothetical protein